MKRTSLALLLVTSLQAGATPIYLCRPNEGGPNFWSSAPCGNIRATMVGSEDVDARYTFDDQVQQAEAALKARKPSSAAILNAPVDPKRCEWLEERIKALDEMARQGQSAPAQGEIARQRKEARDEQFRLRC